MDKAYVQDCKPIVKEAGDSRSRQSDVGLTTATEQARTYETRWIAHSECERLNSYNVKVGNHVCRFSVERLPSGKFVLVCDVM